jgi:hypothetical protein
MARWTVSRITGVPKVSDGDADDPDWYPLQHALGIDTFGANLFVASRSDQTLVEEHDERASGQQELYLVLEGEVIFNLDDERAHLDAGTAIAVTDPAVRRHAKAVSVGTALLIVGAGSQRFKSTWNPDHFAHISRPD